MPRRVGLLLVSVIAAKQPVRIAVVSLDDYLTDYSRRHGIAVLVNKVYRIYRHGLAHRTGLRLHTDKIADDASAFALPEALHKL